MTKNIIIASLIALAIIELAGCASSRGVSNGISGFNLGGNTNLSTSEQPVNLRGFPNDPGFWQGSPGTIWSRLQSVSVEQLRSASVSDPNEAAWIKLALISKQYNSQTSQLVSALTAWRAQYPNHPGNALFPDGSVISGLENSPHPKHIALLLPLTGPLGASGQIVRDGFMSAYYASPNKSQQTVSFIDTAKNPNIAALYAQAVAQGADTVVGPLTKENVQSLSSQGSISVPTLALNYTNGYGSLPNNYYEFGLSPLDEAQQLADKAKIAGHSRALLIATQSEWGQRVAKTLTSRWQSEGGTIVDSMYFNNHTDLTKGTAGLLHIDADADREQMKKENNKDLLAKQRRQDFDVIFLLAPPTSARQIVPLLKYYYAGNVPVYATSVVYSGSPDPTKDSDLNGVTFSDTPWTLQNTAHPNRLFAVGRDAYLLSNEMSRLNKLPAFPLNGATGGLSLTPDHQIYRRLSWAQIRNGRP